MLNIPVKSEDDPLYHTEVNAMVVAINEKQDTADAVYTVAGRTGAIVLTKDDVGLPSVDNTSDTNKPVSTPQQQALNNKVDKSAGLGLSQNSYTDAEKAKLTGVAAGATANDTDANLKNRANHTGTQAATTINEDSTHRFATDAEKTTWNGKEPAITGGATTQYIRGDKSLATLNADVVPDGTTNKAYTATEKTKLGGVATGATVNDTDANLKNRANHTGNQAATTITEDSTHRFATDAEKTTWNGAATTAGNNTSAIATVNTKLSGIAGGAITAAAESVNGIYVPLFTNANLLSASSGLAVAAGGGIVAAVAGTVGSGSLYLPRPIDPTKPWRCAILIEINDSQPITNIQFSDAAGNYWTGARLTSVSTSFINSDWQGGVWLNNYGFTGGIPAGTKLWFGMASDGNTVHQFIIPYTPDGFTFEGGAAYQAAYANYALSAPSKPISTTFSGHKVFGGSGADAQYRLCRLSISTQSVANRIIGAYWAQGLNGPIDNQLSPPFMLMSTTLQDTRAWLVCPGNQGASPIDLVMLPHPNASDYHANLISSTPQAPQLAKIYQAGYLMFGILGSPNTAGYNEATSSNWGAATGMRYRKAQLEWIRANIPQTKNLYVVGQSMGLLNSLSFAYQYPSAVRAIVGISGVTDLNDSFANYGFGSIIQKAYGAAYVCIQAGTGQTPASQPTYWTQISYGFGAPDDVYYQAPYVWRDAYAAGTAYSVNDIVIVPSTAAVGTFGFNNPMYRPSLFKNIPIKLWHGTSDTVIPPSQASNFVNAVNAAGGNATYVPVTGGGHLSTGSSSPNVNVYDGAAVVSFLQANP